jgi:hypothetical protein
MLMNSQFMLDQAARFAQRLEEDAGDDRARQVARAWQLAFSRSPTEAELADAIEFLSGQVEHLETAVEKKDEKGKAAARPTPARQALTDFCQALLSANEFLYVD